MRLRDWMAWQAETPQSFGARIGEPAGNVRRYIQPVGAPRFRRPKPDPMVKIFRETGGLVTPNDFYDLDAPDAPPPPMGQVALEAHGAVLQALTRVALLVPDADTAAATFALLDGDSRAHATARRRAWATAEAARAASLLRRLAPMVLPEGDGGQSSTGGGDAGGAAAQDRHKRRGRSGGRLDDHRGNGEAGGVTRAQEMAAFDALPRGLRDAINYAPELWLAHDVWINWRAGAPPRLIASVIGAAR